VCLDKKVEIFQLSPSLKHFFFSIKSRDFSNIVWFAYTFLCFSLKVDIVWFACIFFYASPLKIKSIDEIAQRFETTGRLSDLVKLGSSLAL
jgi:hypothetical protein